VHTRPFDWRDLPKLHSFRNDTLYLNKALLLTRGPLQTLGAMLASVVPSMGIFTCVAQDRDQTDVSIVGQLIHHSGEGYAYLSFLAPESNLTIETLPPLIDYLVVQAGGRGVQRVLAELDERSQALEGLRRSGFAVYMRQRIWLLSGSDLAEDAVNSWRMASEQDLFAIRLLYSNLVPGLVQQVEPVSLDRPRGLVYYRDGELLGFVELRYGLRGIFARPYIHPDNEEAAQELVALLLNLPSRHARPVYVCVSAYQSWLDGILEDLEARPSPRQVLLVKHLTVKKKMEFAVTVPGLEAHPETFAFTDLESYEFEKST
jgi:hypothetical protein